MQAVILSIGDELALGQNVDTNSAWLSERLTRRGITVRAHATIADVQPDIAAAFDQAAQRADLVIATGGLGPTDDDLTRQALGDALGATLAIDAPSLATLEAFFDERGRPMPEKNRVQAMCPAGATMLANDNGTAPGLHATLHGAAVFVFPGVPSEMEPMHDAYVEPWLVEHAPDGGQTIVTDKLVTFGRGESTVAEMLGDLCARDRNPLVGTTVSGGIISIRIRSTFATEAEARAQLDDTAAKVREALGELVFGSDADTLAIAVGRMLRERGQTVATAESCTGGLVAKMLTDAAGSSEYFHGGFVTYANEAKHRDLDVPMSLIEEDGAVSESVAMAMAVGALERAGADHAISLTGVAGPGGGTDEKPVGTVWIGLATRDGEPAAELHRFHGTRELVRDRAAKTALNLLRIKMLHN